MGYRSRPKEGRRSVTDAPSSAALESAGVAWADLADSADVFAGGARTAPIAGTDRRVVAMPYDFSATFTTVRHGVAKRRDHNAEALSDWLGLDPAAITDLTARGVPLRSTG